MARRHIGMMVLCVWLILVSAPASAITLVAQGKAIATIIVPDEPLKLVSYAADELQVHVEKATGVKLPIVKESEVKDPKASLAGAEAARGQEQEHDGREGDGPVERRGFEGRERGLGVPLKPLPRAPVDGVGRANDVRRQQQRDQREPQKHRLSRLSRTIPEQVEDPQRGRRD